jgi:hypothetical protein
MGACRTGKAELVLAAERRKRKAEQIPHPSPLPGGRGSKS